ncbi:MAG: efflux RND transporter periplasmic adaptor subunit [Candidatus Competibacteraceae bacterium]|nr:efflux RND transporter periplasmic adaptor subunit [Candidatus Competibacteraceae bacterium]
MKRLRLFFFGTAFVVLLYACDAGNSPSTDARKGTPPEVGVMTVVPQTLVIEPEFAGRTTGSSEVEVRAQVKGILLERRYQEGSRVNLGDHLFLIDPKPYEVVLQRAEARLAEAQAKRRAAQREWDRVKGLYDSKAVSERTRDEALSALELAQASVALAQAEVNAARIDLDYTTVEAPIAGIAGREAVSPGNLVGANSEQSLLTRITQLDPLYVEFAITDAFWLRHRQLMDNQLVAVLRLANDLQHTYEGRINFTDTVIDRETSTIQARAVFPNPDASILPGQFVRIALKGLARSDAIAVPERAVLQGPQGAFVYRLGEDSKAEIAPVETGITVAAGWIIEKGLKPGDRVVVDGVIRVRPGQPVKPVDSGDHGIVSPVPTGGEDQ